MPVGAAAPRPRRALGDLGLPPVWPGPALQPELCHHGVGVVPQGRSLGKAPTLAGEGTGERGPGQGRPVQASQWCLTPGPPSTQGLAAAVAAAEPARLNLELGLRSDLLGEPLHPPIWGEGPGHTPWWVFCPCCPLAGGGLDPALEMTERWFRLRRRRAVYLVPGGGLSSGDQPGLTFKQGCFGPREPPGRGRGQVVSRGGLWFGAEGAPWARAPRSVPGPTRQLIRGSGESS